MMTISVIGTIWTMKTIALFIIKSNAKASAKSAADVAAPSSSDPITRTAIHVLTNANADTISDCKLESLVCLTLGFLSCNPAR